MKELRKNLSYADYLNIYEEAHARDGYEIVGIESGSHIFAVMGYRVLVDYVHGKHLYIDYLVSTATKRSKGYGAKLLAYAEGLCLELELECKSLRLCTGLDNEMGQKFYERAGWELRSVVYKKKLIV